MKPADDVEELIRQLKCRATPEFRAAAREKMLAELDKAVAAQRPSLWRTIVTNKATRYATAASILVAALAAVVFWFGVSPDHHGVVLAEAVKRTQAMNTMIHREHRAFYRKGDEKPFLQGEAVKYISTDLGQVEKQYGANGELMYVAYYVKKEKRVVVLFPAVKRYLDLPLTDKLARLTDDVSPKGLVGLLTRHGHAELGRATFDGREVEGFEMSRESIGAVVSAFQDYPEVLILFPVKSAAARLWIDVKTSLPVGVEAELENGRGLLSLWQEGTVRFRAYDFQWNPDLDPEMFVPNIPPDYQPLDLQSIEKPAATGAVLLTLPLVAAYALRHRKCRRGQSSAGCLSGLSCFRD